jgi:hypothetical protein
MKTIILKHTNLYLLKKSCLTLFKLSNSIMYLNIVSICIHMPQNENEISYIFRKRINHHYSVVIKHKHFYKKKNRHVNTYASLGCMFKEAINKKTSKVCYEYFPTYRGQYVVVLKILDYNKLLFLIKNYMQYQFGILFYISSHST